MPTITLLYSSRKGGHRFPCLGLTAAINRMAPYARVNIVNLLDLIPMADGLDRLGRWGDLHLAWLWRRGYRRLHQGKTAFNDIYRLFLELILANPASRRRWRSAIGQTDLLVSFQPEVNCLAQWFKKEHRAPIHSIVMDIIPHAGWVDPRLDYYYAAMAITRQELIRHGAPAGRILVTGAPVQPGYEKVMSGSPAEQRRRLGLNPNLFTLLVMAGYLGNMVDYRGIINRLLSLNQAPQILVLAGQNRQLYQRLCRQSHPRLQVYQNVPSIHPLMWAADLVISKPGGMVIADALALGKPMILINPRAGSLQEIFFAAEMEKQGICLHLPDARPIGAVVQKIIEQPEISCRLVEAGQPLGRKNRAAARVIAEKILRACGPRPGFS